MQKAIPKREEAQGVDNALASAQAKENVGKEWPRTPEEFKKKLLKKLKGSVDVNESHISIHHRINPGNSSFLTHENGDICILNPYEYEWPDCVDGDELDKVFREVVYKHGVDRFHYLPSKLLSVNYTWVFQNRTGEVVDVTPMGKNLIAVCPQESIFDGDSLRVDEYYCPLILMREFNGYYVFSTFCEGDAWFESKDETVYSFEYVDVLAVKKEVWDEHWSSYVNGLLAEDDNLLSQKKVN